MIYLPVALLLYAFVLDLILGDPVYPLHPVRLIGRLITLLEPPFRKISGGRRLSGMLFFLAVAGISCSLIYLILFACSKADSFIPLPLFSSVVSLYVLYSGISVRDLFDKAMEIHSLLNSGDLQEARRALSWIVGRDTDELSEAGIIRATVETVAENMVDGIISPLFFAFLGGPVALAGYKAVNTLDSMVGYKNSTYIYFGRASAYIDDAANYIPARLSPFLVFLAALILRQNAAESFRTALRDGQKSPSPNSAVSEAAVAGALGIQLGGPCSYKGVVSDKPFIGNRKRELHPDDIKRTLHLVILASVLFLLAGSALSVTVRFFLFK